MDSLSHQVLIHAHGRFTKRGLPWGIPRTCSVKGVLVKLNILSVEDFSVEINYHCYLEFLGK